MMDRADAAGRTSLLAGATSADADTRAILRHRRSEHRRSISAVNSARRGWHPALTPEIAPSPPHRINLKKSAFLPTFAPSSSTRRSPQTQRHLPLQSQRRADWGLCRARHWH